MNNKFYKNFSYLVIIFSSVFLSCSNSSTTSSGSSRNYPLLKPPVEAATPQGFGGTAPVSSAIFPHYEKNSLQSLYSLTPSNFKDRFFNTSGGPTNIFRILTDIDSRISGYNSATSTATCLTQNPVSYTITAFGQSIAMKAQCYQTIGASYTGDPGLIQWGVDSNKVFYLWTAIGAGWTAAIATPITGSTQYSIQAWSTVGVDSSASGSGSYGVIQLSANPVTASLEMSVAGVGFGFCGAQYKSDGTNIYGEGSEDAGSSCDASSNICVSAADASTSATCTTAEKAFTLPALGRIAGSSWNASTYPGSSLNNVTLVRADTTDSVHFGGTAPIVPTTGVGAFQ